MKNFFCVCEYDDPTYMQSEINITVNFSDTMIILFDMRILLNLLGFQCTEKYLSVFMRFKTEYLSVWVGLGCWHSIYFTSTPKVSL